MFDENDSSLQVVRIELNKHNTIFFYYKPYVKEDSLKFPPGKSILIFYFEPDLINENIIKEYFSLIGKIDTLSLGNYLNKSGSKKKRRVINFALIKFNKVISTDDLNKSTFQDKIINYLEERKNRYVNVNYKLDENKLIDDDIDEFGKPDEEGFFEVKASGSGNKFKPNLGADISCKVIKEDNDSFMDEIKVTRKKKRRIGGVFKKEEQDEELEGENEKEKNEGFWNIQIREKQKRSKS